MGADNLFVVREFSNGHRVTVDAVECPGRL
jgi:hypothetical protein